MRYMKTNSTYSGDHLSEISFPLGGIGSGCLGLSGNGRLIDWEIFGRPNKGGMNGFSHFAVKAEDKDGFVDARVLQGDINPPFSGKLTGQEFGSFGFGPDRGTMAGIPHFREVEFTGEYPFARLAFQEPDFPAEMSLTAFNPLIPLNDRDSSIPGAFFEIECRNTSSRELTITIASSCTNPFPLAGKLGGSTKEHGSVNRAVSLGRLSGAYLTNDSLAGGDCGNGNLTVLTDASDVAIQENWYRGAWFDGLNVFWHDLCSSEGFASRKYLVGGKPVAGKNDTAVVAGKLCLAPGETGSMRFAITWSFPVMSNYWKPSEPESRCCEDEGCRCSSNTWKHYYATLFDTSLASATYSLENWERLHEESRLYQKALFSSTVPADVVDAVSANVSILKSPTTLRLEDGTFYGFEGCHPGSGCCEGSCTHVWNYAYALPFLFPGLERSMRDADFKYNLGEDGGMGFRLQLPAGTGKSDFRPCADGQFGGILKVYRDWKISGDTEWLKGHWDAVKANISYAWSEQNPDRWDIDRDGVLEGRQHHTLDMELFGPNSWLTGMYLGALLAAAEMAKHLGDQEAEAEFRRLFDSGSSYAEEHLFNGSYFQQILDITDKSVLESFESPNEVGILQGGKSVVDAYWDDEHGEIKYQIGDGCAIDQILGQWHANISGLGRIFPEKQTRSALEAIYTHNFKRRMGDHFNPCRLYCVQDEGGVVICSFPRNRPIIPAPYSEETMNGFEYQAACHMIQEGMVSEGLEVVSAIRDRYDGRRRNPWNEFECGSNYARSMASFALLPALSGFTFDMVKGQIGFDPVPTETYNPESDSFSCLWSLGPAWGEYKQTPLAATIQVHQGELSLQSVRLPLVSGKGPAEVRIGDSSIEFALVDGEITFDAPVLVTSGCELIATW
jgi:non-lysosomal glucosylceramidase